MKEIVQLGKRSYPIIFEQGVISHIGEYVNLNRNVMVIKDPNVPEHFANRIVSQCKKGYVHTVCEGEEAKSMAVFEDCLKDMLHHSFTRKDLVIALGGGVTGDLAGFVASAYMRGIDFVNIPTTTLSQIDSSVGGKVAINLDGIKNCVGAFYQPKAVFIDSDTLASLPKRQWYNGLVEAWKAGLIQDPVICDLMEEDMEKNLQEVIHRSIVMKKHVVEEDETEQGLRKILNFGHTIGHGVESYYGLHDVLHGEAVAIGMVKILTNPELKERTIQQMKRMGIDVDLTYDKEKVFAFMQSDKKRQADGVDAILVDEIGQARIERLAWETIYDML